MRNALQEGCRTVACTCTRQAGVCSETIQLRVAAEDEGEGEGRGRGQRAEQAQDTCTAWNALSLLVSQGQIQ
jgi:hypothetical protein